MKRRKNLERAVILGLLLSTSVYGSVFAAEVDIQEFKNSADTTGHISVTEDTIVTGNSSYSGGEGNSNSLDNKTITVSNGASLILNNVHMLKPNIEGDGNVVIKITDDNANTAGIHVSGNITANSVNIDVSEATSVKGVNAYGDVIINANKVDIKGAYNGFFLTPEVNSANVIINYGETVNIDGGSSWGLQSEGSNKNITITSDNLNSNITISSKGSGGITNNCATGDTILKAGSINVDTSHYYAVIGLSGDITLEATNGDNTIQGGQAGLRNKYGKVQALANFGSNNISLVQSGGTMGGIQSDSGATAEMIVTARDYNRVYADEFGAGVYSRGNNIMNIEAGIDNIITGTTGIKSTGTGTLNVTAGGNNIIGFETNETEESTDHNGYIGEIGVSVTSGNVNLTGQNNFITSNSFGVSVVGEDSYATLDSKANYISAVNEGIGDVTGVEVKDKGNFNLSKKDGYVTEIVDISAIADNGNATGISLDNAELITDPALDTLNITSISKNIEDNKATGISLNSASTFSAQAENISILAGQDYSVYGAGEAINALNGSSVTLNSNSNNITGAVYAEGEKTSVSLSGFNANSNPKNYVYSAAVIDGAGDLAGKTQIDNPDPNGDKFTGMDVVSALYAEEGAEINLSGVNDIRTYYGDPNDEHTSERAVWAYKGSDINIDGLTTIKTYLYEKSPNSMDLAIAAGTATNLDFDTVNANNPEEGMAIIDIDYDSYTYDDNGVERTAVSSIEGDILAAYGGIVDVAPKSADTVGINITGNLLAGNNGDLTVNLGNGGVLTGRADDYGDAGVVDNSGHGTTFFDPAFSSEIYKGGQVNLDMGENSRWNVTGQSWITSIDTTNDSGNVRNNAIIDLISANTDRNTTAHALTVYNMNGNATFNMSLDADRNVSDMLYIKNADGNYIINVVDAVTTADMYANGFDGLRFATVGEGSNANFRAVTVDQGVLNVEYEVDTDSYANNDENTAYNGGSNMSDHKPGDTMVEGFFGSNGVPGEPIETPATNGIMTLNLAAEENAETFTDDSVVEAKEGALNEVTNFKLVARKGEELSDGGKAVLNMSRANYSNAIYMDRLNKRLGEARYINDDPEEDEGMWVRIRHDSIGKEDAFRSQNTMYQLGYDKRQECDNGERRVGFAVDYMHGDTGYTDIAGKGEIDRYGLWLYDTWMGDKGHYADYIAKWGHLDNDFEIYAPTTGQRIDGDYSNNVFSVSAEYGRKKDIGNDWYFEPQAQLQLARVTGADYTTSQGTKVSVDGINSLIGRAGFRIGKDFGEQKQSTVYIKADVLHEFLGDQDVSVMDDTTNGRYVGIGYENEGTWYDVGFGFATQTGKNSYAFMDFEKSFGHDNDETYQINAGVQWTF